MKVLSHILRFFAFGIVLFHLTGCGRNAPSNTVVSGQSNSSFVQSHPELSALLDETNAAAAAFPIYTCDVVAVRPHDRSASTQGLVFLQGILLESTGLNGQSSLRKVDLESGNVLQRIDLPAHYFAEGIAVLNGTIFQLTWQNKKGFVYDLESFQLEKEFSYQGEGWGLTTDGHWLIMSDGTDQIRFLDPATFEEKRRITVLVHGRPVNLLNELEYIRGELFANVWGTDYVVRIDPVTGRVLGVVDFSGLLAPRNRDEDTDVLNGIAYDAIGDRLFVTGKQWPALFEVRLKLKN